MKRRGVDFATKYRQAVVNADEAKAVSNAAIALNSLLHDTGYAPAHVTTAAGAEVHVNEVLILLADLMQTDADRENAKAIDYAIADGMYQSGATPVTS